MTVATRGTRLAGKRRCAACSRTSCSSGALLIQLLRYYMRTRTEVRGLLRALIDPRLARALSAMHERPEAAWNVSLLAGEANMSRSTFTRHFAECMGLSPMGYLFEWRMRLAE